MNKPAPIVQRRLAAIFCADVAGYTRLMHTDEPGTLRLLSSHREITDRLIAQYGGRIANTAGDSILAEFPSSVYALQCALAIQERIAAVNEEAPKERRMAFRIGLHVGEAMVRGGDLFGDGVNAAARMQSLAEPGSVCVSASVHEYVHRVLPLTFEDLGPQSIKNFDAPMRAFLVRPSGELLSRAIPQVYRNREIYLVRRLYGILSKASMNVLRPEGLASLDAPALASIEDAPGIDRQELAERLAIDRVKSNRIILRLTRRGLVEQTPKDDGRRLRGLRLTPSGLEMRERLRPAGIAEEDRVMAALSERERETLRELMTRVIRANGIKIPDLSEN